MSFNKDKLELIKKNIASFPDFPKPGVLFRDIFSVFQEPQVSQVLREVLADHVKSIDPPVQCIAALDARGFLLGSILSLDLKIPFVPIRKKGKLPGKVRSCTYELEYGQDTVEIQEDSFKPGTRVLIIDDLLATGGSLMAACALVKQLQAEVVECLVVIELQALNGRKRVLAPLHSLIKY